MAPDTELFLAWTQGDQAAGEQLFGRHYEGIARFFRNKASEDWAELCQRTFLACLEAAPKFRADGSFRSFLFGIAYRQLYRYFRERDYDRARIDFEARSVQDLDPTASSLVVANDEQRLLLSALRRIPLEYQVILELHYWEDMTAQACGEILDIPLGTAKTRLRRARQLLEQQLASAQESPELITRTLSGLDSWARHMREQLQG